MIRRAHHVSLVVRDIERSRHFYEDVLGLRPIARPEFGFGGAWYDAQGVELHLIVPPEGIDTGRSPEALTPVAPHLAFAVGDYGATLASLRMRGVEVLETGPDVGQLFVRDPDGNMIELIEPGGRLGR